jgi:hypothetical protein
LGQVGLRLGRLCIVIAMDRLGASMAQCETSEASYH